MGNELENDSAMVMKLNLESFGVDGAGYAVKISCFRSLRLYVSGLLERGLRFRNLDKHENCLALRVQD